MTGDEPPLLRVGELARRSGLTVRTLHHYDQIGLLQPSGRSGGDHRLYSVEDVRRLVSIQQLKGLGMGLAEVQAALDDPGFDAAATLETHISALRDELAERQALLTRLESLRGAADVGWEELLEVVVLLERLRHPDANIRVRAALNAPEQAPLPALLEQLASDPDEAVRETLTWAVVQQGPAATPAVVGRLSDPDPAVRLQLAHVLSKLADPAAVPALVRLLDDEVPVVAAKSAFALGQLGDPAAIAALTQRLGQGDETQRDTVASALALLAPGSLPGVVARLGDVESAVRRHALDVLALIGDPSRAGEVARLLRDPEPAVRFDALVALGQMLPADRDGSVQAAVREALDSPDDHVRLLATRLLRASERR